MEFKGVKVKGVKADVAAGVITLTFAVPFEDFNHLFRRHPLCPMPTKDGE